MDVSHKTAIHASLPVSDVLWHMVQPEPSLVLYGDELVCM